MTATTVERPRRITCDEHNRYTAGCRICQQRSAARGRIRHRLLAYGTWRGMVDPAPAQQHATALVGLGWTGRKIADAAKVARSVVHRLLAGERVEMRSETSDAILALPLTAYSASGHDRVNSIGAARRLQALTAIGHAPDKLAADLGTNEQSVRRWRRQARTTISAQHHQAICDLYDRLSTVPGTSERARADARRSGYMPPLAWDDDAIDDPSAKPDLGSDGADVIDEVAVRRALTGERVRLTRAEREHAFRVGIAAGMTPYAIGSALGMSGTTYMPIYRRITQAA